MNKKLLVAFLIVLLSELWMGAFSFCSAQSYKEGLLSSSKATATSDTIEDVLSAWNYIGDGRSALYGYFAGQAFEILDRRRSMLLKFDSKQAWLQRQTEVKNTYNRIIGAFPGKTPLKPVVTGILEREDVRVEKLYFESLPGYYVTAALFLPVNNKEKHPAVIFCSGHSQSGFRSKGYQRAILNLAKRICRTGF